MIDEIGDGRREPIGVDPHRRKLRAKRLQPFANRLAQMIETRIVEMTRAARDRSSAQTESDGRWRRAAAIIVVAHTCIR